MSKFYGVVPPPVDGIRPPGSVMYSWEEAKKLVMYPDSDKFIFGWRCKKFESEAEAQAFVDDTTSHAAWDKEHPMGVYPEKKRHREIRASPLRLSQRRRGRDYFRG